MKDQDLQNSIMRIAAGIIHRANERGTDQVSRCANEKVAPEGSIEILLGIGELSGTSKLCTKEMGFI